MSKTITLTNIGAIGLLVGLGLISGFALAIGGAGLIILDAIFDLVALVQRRKTADRMEKLIARQQGPRAAQ